MVFLESTGNYISYWYTFDAENDVKLTPYHTRGNACRFYLLNVCSCSYLINNWELEYVFEERILLIQILDLTSISQTKWKSKYYGWTDSKKLFSFGHKSFQGPIHVIRLTTHWIHSSLFGKPSQECLITYSVKQIIKKKIIIRVDDVLVLFHDIIFLL